MTTRKPINDWLFDHAKVVFLDRPYCELRRGQGRYGCLDQGNVRDVTHDLRRVYPGAYDFDAYFRVVLDDLLVGKGERKRIGREERVWMAYLVLGSVGWWVRRWVELEVRVEELQKSPKTRGGRLGFDQRDEWVSGDASRTCCETKQFRGPTSAKMPI